MEASDGSAQRSGHSGQAAFVEHQHVTKSASSWNDGSVKLMRNSRWSKVPAQGFCRDVVILKSKPHRERSLTGTVWSVVRSRHLATHSAWGRLLKIIPASRGCKAV
jgi:hypothetical protein